MVFLAELPFVSSYECQSIASVSLSTPFFDVYGIYLNEIRFAVPDKRTCIGAEIHAKRRLEPEAVAPRPSLRKMPLCYNIHNSHLNGYTLP